MLEIQNLNVYYGDFQALFNLSLRVPEGETVITVGPNGSANPPCSRPFPGFSSLDPVR